MRTELSQRQSDTYDVLLRDVRALEQSPVNRKPERVNRVLRLGVDLSRMCRELESALAVEDKRLTEDGTSDELDDRWIKNLRRLETMQALLDRAKAVG